MSIRTHRSYFCSGDRNRFGLLEPVISVDTKKKELIGNYANGGREWRPAKEPERVNVHDFADRTLGEFAKAIPYGVYDVGNDEGWVSVCDSADTAEFAVESIRRWWNTLGRNRFPHATTRSTSGLVWTLCGLPRPHEVRSDL